MFDVEKYLHRLGYAGPVEPTEAVLRELHKRHLMAIPYDTGSDLSTRPLPDNLARIDLDQCFEEVVVGGQGAYCFPLNGLFRALLAELGFEVSRISASISTGTTFSPDRLHLFTGVRLDGENFLADVGYSGPSFLEPLRLVEDVQKQYGCSFRLAAGTHRVLRRKARNGTWRDIYRFAFQDRDVQHWDGFSSLLSDSFSETVFRGTNICCRATENGHRMLAGKRYLEVVDGVETVRALTRPAEYQTVLESVLGGRPAGPRKNPRDQPR
ncbi:MAG TPA: arylamine N-acetyltransferase [Amycolatopsis sp.]|uniref:arylamine N-acetyltransferase family protein n=1 Tax=Amycolatopsis sp. TaxID=37632 RepID=UPI002B48C5FB|nr:arylamine N-acetyltransferase [Amycolatopsis sp.]HKS49202.1 arylamine N-acetyltransferase [Amycolatopsis sp.]